VICALAAVSVAACTTSEPITYSRHPSGSGGAKGGTSGGTGAAGSTGTGTGAGGSGTAGATGAAGSGGAGGAAGAAGAGGAAGGSAGAAGGTAGGAGGASGAVAGAVARYRFDDGSGTMAADSSGSGRNAALTGGTSWGTGMIGGDLVLDGTSGYATLPAGMLDTASAVTIAVWVNVRTARNWQRVFDFGSSTTTYMFLTPQSSVTGTLRFAITMGGNAAEQQLDGSAALPAGAWHHVAVVLNGSAGTLYQDGQPVGTNPAMTLVPSSLGALTNYWVGRSEFTADPFLDGQLDELVIYSRALSAAEITTLFNQR
jgi:hypothetical protein